jgi:predicted nucleic acid-binding protein
MPHRYVLDAYAWVDYLRGSQPGRRVKELVESGRLYTCSVTLANVCAHVAKESQDAAMAAHAIQTLSDIVEIDNDLALRAAKRYERMKEKDWETVYVLETAKKLGAEIISTNKDFSSGRKVPIS